MERVITKQHLFNYEFKHKAFLRKYTDSYGDFDFFDYYGIDIDKLSLEFIDKIIMVGFFDLYVFNEDEIYNFLSDYKDLIDVSSFMQHNKVFSRENLELIVDIFKDQIDKNSSNWDYIMTIFMQRPELYSKSFLTKYKDKFNHEKFNRHVFNHGATISGSVYRPYKNIIDKIRKYTMEHLEEILYGE